MRVYRYNKELFVDVPINDILVIKEADMLLAPGSCKFGNVLMGASCDQSA